MSCKTYNPMLHSYINNELNVLEKAEVERHLQECQECKNEELDIKRLKLVIDKAKPDKVQLMDIKQNIMAAIKVTVKARTAAYDIKVLGRLGASLIACGMLVLFLNFSALGNNIEAQRDKLGFGAQGVGQIVAQPIDIMSKGLTDMSSKILDLNGITFRLEQRIRGGM
jgi:hypothetical protein